MIYIIWCHAWPCLRESCGVDFSMIEKVWTRITIEHSATFHDFLPLHECRVLAQQNPNTNIYNGLVWVWFWTRISLVESHVSPLTNLESPLFIIFNAFIKSAFVLCSLFSEKSRPWGWNTPPPRQPGWFPAPPWISHWPRWSEESPRRAPRGSPHHRCALSSKMGSNMKQPWWVKKTCTAMGRIFNDFYGGLWRSFRKLDGNWHFVRWVSGSLGCWYPNCTFILASTDN